MRLFRRYRSFTVQNTVDLAWIRAPPPRCRLVANDASLGESGISYEVVCMAQGYEDVSDVCRKVVLPLREQHAVESRRCDQDAENR